VVLFANSGLYSEAGLYCLYVVMGIYGWVQWNSIDTGTAVALVDVPLKMQWPAIAGIPLAILLGTKMASVEGVSYPYFDAFTTVFALIATYQEARRIRTAFHYWIPLNIASMVLYGMKGLVIYAALMFIYSVMSVLGYLNWRK
jgi:nicotinamide mononucleotide transporter